MNSTKFVVVKLKELVKTVVFAVLGIVILIGLISFFLHFGEEKTGAYTDGTYETALLLNGSEAKVSVTVEKGKISGVELAETSRETEFFYPLLAEVVGEVEQAVVKNQSLAVSVSPENARSAQAVLNAVAEGLKTAKR